MKAVVVLVAVVLGLFAVCESANLPGFNSIITQNGLNYGVQVALEQLQTKLKDLVIPDQHGDTDTISWKITNLKLNSILIPTASIVIDPNIGLTVQIFKASGSVSTDWWFQDDIFTSINGSGQATVDITDMYMSVILTFSLNSLGYPIVDANSVSVTIQDLTLHFSGSNLDYILDLLKSLFGSLIKTQVQSGLESAITSAINVNLNQELSTLSTHINVSSDAYIDMQLVQPIMFPTNSYFTLLQRGEFYATANPRNSPFTPSLNLPTAPQNSEMLQIYVDQFVPNTASWVFFKLGKLFLTINASEVPSNSPIQFNTSSWQTLIPALYTKYPNWLMQVQVYPLSPPTINFTSAGGFINGRGAVSIRVINPSNPSDIRDAFLLGLNMSGSVKAGVTGNNITGAITNVKETLNLISSQIGPVNTVPLGALANYLVGGQIIPKINEILAVGIPIPTIDGVSVVTADVSFGPGYIFIAADVQYIPPQ